MVKSCQNYVRHMAEISFSDSISQGTWKITSFKIKPFSYWAVAWALKQRCERVLGDLALVNFISAVFWNPILKEILGSFYIRSLCGQKPFSSRCSVIYDSSFLSSPRWESLKFSKEGSLFWNPSNLIRLLRFVLGNQHLSALYHQTQHDPKLFTPGILLENQNII